MKHAFSKVCSLLLSVVLLLSATACSDEAGSPEASEQGIVVPEKLSAWIHDHLENFKDDTWMTMQAFSAAYDGRRSVTYDLSGEISMYFSYPMISVGVQNGTQLDLTKPLTERATLENALPSGDPGYYIYEFWFEQSEDVYIRVRVDLGTEEMSNHDTQIDQVTDAMIQAFADREAKADTGTIWTGGAM